MQIKIIKAGVLTTVQDLGRKLFRTQAIPLGGAMDRLASRLANKAVGNSDDAAVLEFTYADAELIATTDLLIAHSGNGACFKLGEQKLPSNRPLFIPAGNKISLANNPKGCRSYLAVSGGWRVETILGSKSTYLTAKFGGLEGRTLKANDILNANSNLTSMNEKIFAKLKGNEINFPKWGIGNSFIPNDLSVIRVVPAQEFTWFNGASIINFLTEPYILSSQSNRMGFHLTGKQMKKINHTELLSTAVTFGTIQVTGNGELVLLMADAQTTGGYPRIAQVAAVDLPICAQLKPNDKIFFQEISRQTAESLYLQLERELSQLDTALSHKFD